MADAVADEIDEIKRDITEEVETKLNLMGNRVQNAQLCADRAENEQAKLKFELEKVSQDLKNRMTTDNQ